MKREDGKQEGNNKKCLCILSYIEDYNSKMEDFLVTIWKISSGGQIATLIEFAYANVIILTKCFFFLLNTGCICLVSKQTHVNILRVAWVYKYIDV